MPEPVIILRYDPTWRDQFHDRAQPMRDALDTRAHRIDHIGSTAVPGLAAKPVIDIQISVASFDADFYAPLHALGYRWQRDNPDLTKRYFREPPGTPRTHIHVRVSGSFSQQAALMFRDYLRQHPDDAAAYAALKRRLAEQFRDQRAAYVNGKSDFVWQILQHADQWAQRTGWRPAPTDI